MRAKIIFACAAAIFTLCAVAPLALAVDADDDIKPDDGEKIEVDVNVTSEQSRELEAKFPTEAAAVRTVIQNHVDHASKKDLDAYMADFVAERIRYPELERDYAKRAMALKDLKLELRAVEFAQLSRNSATVLTRQISSYTDDQGKPVVDDAIISYKVILNGGKTWKIAFTERKRLVAP